MWSRSIAALSVTVLLLPVAIAQRPDGDTAPPAAPAPILPAGATPPAPTLSDCVNSILTLPQATECVKLAEKELHDAVTKKVAAEAQKTAVDTALAESGKALNAAQEAAKADAKDTKKAEAVIKANNTVVEAKEKLAKAVADVATYTSEVQTAAANLEKLKQKAEKSQKSVDRNAVAAANGCDEPLTICLTSDGVGLGDNAIPTEAFAGDILNVKVFMTLKEKEDDKVTVIVTSSLRKSVETQFDSRAVKLRSSDTEQPSNKDALVLYNVFALPAIGEDATDIVIQISQTKADKTQSARIRIPINGGRSYYSIAFLVAATYRGERTIHRDLTATSDTTLESGFALNLFPGGRRRGVIGYFGSCGHFWRCVADTLGLQLGTDLDLTNPFDRVFAGIVFEPVSGLSFSTGLSIRQLPFLPPNSDHQGLVTEMTAISTVQLRVVRPYFGITITFDLLDIIAKVKAPTRPGG